MRYEIIIKSHTEAPDYEDSCEADSKEEAVAIFKERIGGASGEDWDASFLADNIQEV
jgi:hypothetical protein